MSKESTYYKYLAFFILYFFFNNFWLKEGLLYTSLLTPVFLYWLYKRRQLSPMLKWGILLIVPIPFQLISGVDAGTYLVSTMLVITAWVFLFTSLEAIRASNESLEDIFKKAVLINAGLFIIALLLLPFPSLRDFMWDSVPMSRGLEAIPRLQLLAYEPSHYGLLLAPVFLFFILKVITGKSGHPLLMAAAIGFPLLLTFSFGIIGALVIAVIIGSVAYFHQYNINSRRLIIYASVFLFVVIASLWLFWPHNPLFIRMDNIITGADSSSKGRLVHSFMFAKDLIMQHNPLMGVGPGQVKIMAHDLIVNFYQYTGAYAEIVRIPNSMAEILATYGIYGFLIKIFLEIFFFFRLKVYRNLYALCLFVFIFIYQFTGSFLVNAAEIGAWAIVFNSRFLGFETNSLKTDPV